MPPHRPSPFVERIRGLAAFLAGSDALRVRIQREDDEIELVGRPALAVPNSPGGDGAAAATATQRLDTIKADLVGIFRLSRPAPIEGDVFAGDRELGYIEALGIRTPIHSMGGGRIVAIAAGDGAAVEYGQPLFTLDRG